MSARSYLCSAFWRIRLFGKRPPRTESETQFRLWRLASRTPLRQPGDFVFPFGKVRYVDLLSLAGQYEDIFIRRVYDFKADTPKPKILDCGGNVGMSVIRFKQQYPSADVVVLEADPEIALVLENNLRSMGLDDVELVNAAAWTENGSVSFQQDAGDGGAISLNAAKLVRSVRLDDLVDTTIDLLKMDVEGAEFDLLLSICETGKIRNVKRLICELHERDASGRKIAELLAALAQQKFNICLGDARPAPDLSGENHVTPFPAVEDGKCLVELYAWQT